MRHAEDLSHIEYVLENFKSVTAVKDASGKPVYSQQFRDANNKPAPLIRFEKKVDGTYYVVEAVADSADKKIHVVSAYMQKIAAVSTKC